MHPHGDAERLPTPGLAVFAAALRFVLRTRHDSPVDGPDALESWSDADGYAWRWSTPVGLWRVTAGGVVDSRPLLHGPGGIWRVDAEPDEHAAAMVLHMLRAAGAIPAATSPDRRVMPCCSTDMGSAYAQGRGVVCRDCGTAYAPPVTAQAERWQPRDLHRPYGTPALEYGWTPTPSTPNRVAARRYAVVRGQVFTPPAGPGAQRAVFYRPSDPTPKVPAGHLAVPAVSDRPDDNGHWEVQMPDGYRRIYDPAQRCLIPYELPDGTWSFLLFEADQLPGGVYPARPDVAPPAYAPGPSSTSNAESRGAA